jgi:hypothetical protein
MGGDAGIFAGGEYDEDDREADDVWEKIDDHMDTRRKCVGTALSPHVSYQLPSLTAQYAKHARQCVSLSS